MPEVEIDEGLQHIEWKAQEGFSTVSTEHALALVKEIKALRATVAELRAALREKGES